MNRPGHFVWNELLTRKVDEVKRFYSSLLGWEFRHWEEGNYLLIRRDDQEVGGLMPIGGDVWEGVPNFWMAYIQVEQIDQLVGRVEELGGKLIEPPMEVPGVGRIAIVADPSGAVVGLIQFASPSDDSQAG